MTSSNLGSDETDTSYDLYILVKWKSPPLVYDADGTALPGAWEARAIDTLHSGRRISDVWGWPGGIVHLGLPRDAASRYGKALRAAHGSGILVPTTCRMPIVSPEEGLTVAKQEFDRMRRPDHVYGGDEQIEMVDEYCWWRYGLADLTAQAQEIIPGVLYVFVHKLTGEVSAPTTVGAWIKAHTIE